MSFLSLITLILLTTASLPISQTAYAQGGGLSTVKDIANQNELGEDKSAKEILQTIVKWLLSLVATIAVISLVYGGFKYITSQGDENQAQQAKNIILYSVIGLIIIGLSAIIVNVVISITQV